MAFESFKLCLFLCLWRMYYAFLLDTSTPAYVGNIMTDNHYESLLKLFMDEHTARIQLQQQIVIQQQQIASLSGMQSRIQTLESTTAIIDRKTNSTVDIYEKYSNLEKKYEEVFRKQVQLQDDLNTSRNRTGELESEVESLKHIQAINQVQALSTLQQEVQKINTDIKTLYSTEQARGQDLFAIYGEVTNSKQKLDSLVNNTTAFSVDFNFFKNTQNNITNELTSKQQSLNLQMRNLTSAFSKEKEFVGFTSFGTAYGDKSSGAILKFPDIQTVYGLSNHSTFKNTGVFTCETDGLYLIIVTLVSGSTTDNKFRFFKNSQPITHNNYIGKSGSSTRDFLSGTGSVLVRLIRNDGVYVRNENSNIYIIDELSTLTLIKLH